MKNVTESMRRPFTRARNACLTHPLGPRSAARPEITWSGSTPPPAGGVAGGVRGRRRRRVRRRRHRRVDGRVDRRGHRRRDGERVVVGRLDRLGLALVGPLRGDRGHVVHLGRARGRDHRARVVPDVSRVEGLVGLGRVAHQRVLALVVDQLDVGQRDVAGVGDREAVGERVTRVRGRGAGLVERDRRVSAWGRSRRPPARQPGSPPWRGARSPLRAAPSVCGFSCACLPRPMICRSPPRRVRRHP